MKKIITLVLCLTFALPLAACARTMDDAASDAQSIKSSVESGAESMKDKADSTMQSAEDSVKSGDMQVTTKITAGQARNAALAHAGLTDEDVKDVNVDLDRDNGVLIYEVDFNHGDTEYDYDINAETGEIISSNKSKN